MSALSRLRIALPPLAIAVLLPWIPGSNTWVTTFAYVGIFALAALGVVLLTGLAGMLSFGQSAFVGIGAYATALVTIHLGLSAWLGLLAGLAVTTLCAALLGRITLPMKGPYLPITTMLWGLALSSVFANLELLGRNDGLSGIAPIMLFGRSLADQNAMFTLSWIVVAVALLALHNFVDSRLGRATRAMLNGSTMPEAMGIDTVHLKTVVFVIAALLASIAGWLYAHLVRAISPSAFGFNYGVEFVFMAVVGGIGQLWGAILGAGLLTVVKDVLQTYVPRVLPVQGNFESVLFGAVIIFVLIRTRQGLWPWITRRFARPSRHRVAAPPRPMPRAAKPDDGALLLQVQDIEKRFGGLRAVDRVSFDVHARRIVALIGPNGAGKSTTFNLVTGLLPLSAGRVMYLGRPIHGQPMRRILQAGIARTFQHVQLLADMTVLENVAIGAHLRAEGDPRRGVMRSILRLNGREEQALLGEAAHQLQRVGLQDVMHEAAGSLSLGQQRLVEIARALCADPTLLLLDEPAAGLRVLEKERLAALLGQLRSEGLAILLVEHDMDFVMGLADHVVVMDFGVRIAQGTPAQIQQDPLVLEAYLGAVEPPAAEAGTPGAADA